MCFAYMFALLHHYPSDYLILTGNKETTQKVRPLVLRIGEFAAMWGKKRSDIRRGLFFFSFILGLVLILAGGILVRGIKTESTIENRELNKFPKFSVSSFITGDYQTDFEQALSDQLFLGATLKTSYNNIKNQGLRIVVSSLKATRPSKEPPNENADDNSSAVIFPDLTPRGNNLFELDDSHHLVFPKYDDQQKARELFQSKADNINSLADSYPGVNFYCFYIETDTDIDFINKEIDHSLVGDFAQCLGERINIGTLAIDLPEEYQKWFFLTDHHWNPVGQKAGYQEIIALLKGSEESLLETKIITLPDIHYNGYKSRKIDDYLITDEFGLLQADLPPHEIYINRQKAAYGNKAAYTEGSYSNAQGFNHYAVCYGYDYGLVEYRYDQPEKGNLLVFVESFSNPINELIAAHFNNTYFIDLRHYAKDMSQPFDLGDFIKGKNIDQVLLTGYFYFFANDVFLIDD